LRRVSFALDFQGQRCPKPWGFWRLQHDSDFGDFLYVYAKGESSSGRRFVWILPWRFRCIPGDALRTTLVGFPALHHPLDSRPAGKGGRWRSANWHAVINGVWRNKMHGFTLLMQPLPAIYVLSLLSALASKVRIRSSLSLFQRTIYARLALSCSMLFKCA